MKRVGLWIALALSVGFNVGLLASRIGGAGEVAPEDRRSGWAHAHRHSGGEHGHVPFVTGREEVARSLERAAEHLELDGEAREEFVSRHRELIVAVFEARRERRGLERELGRQLGGAEPDRARVGELVDALAENRREVERRFAETVLATRASLEPRQERRYLHLVRMLRSHLGGRRTPGDARFLPGRGRRGPGGERPAAPVESPPPP